MEKTVCTVTLPHVARQCGLRTRRDATAQRALFHALSACQRPEREECESANFLPASNLSVRCGGRGWGGGVGAQAEAAINPKLSMLICTLVHNLPAQYVPRAKQELALGSPITILEL